MVLSANLHFWVHNSQWNSCKPVLFFFQQQKFSQMRFYKNGEMFSTFQWPHLTYLQVTGKECPKPNYRFIFHLHPLLRTKMHGKKMTLINTTRGIVGKLRWLGFLNQIVEYLNSDFNKFGWWIQFQGNDQVDGHNFDIILISFRLKLIDFDVILIKRLIKVN